MAGAGLDNKISNIIGTKVPQWLINQFDTRANRNSDDTRDNDNLLYLANKTGWVRLVSSVNFNEVFNEELGIFDSNVRDNFSKQVGISLDREDSLAKNYILFGGTSKYSSNSVDQSFNYNLRSGISLSNPNRTEDGAYGMLGIKEIQNYGFKPMPGISSVNIETQGRLGSVRSATINFKCWDKTQLDIIDALYFKLGFSMFLEWGHTYFYDSENNNQLKSTEDYSLIDLFAENTGLYPSKEEILAKISKTIRQTEGNYDAMLGIVTNYDFKYTEDGGYDCILKIMSLGMLADSIKINNPATLPTLLEEEIFLLDKTIKELSAPPPIDENLTSKIPENSKPNDLLQPIALNNIEYYDFEKLARTGGVNNTGIDTYEKLKKEDPTTFNTIAFTNTGGDNDATTIARRDFNQIVGQIKSGNRPTFIYAPSNSGRKVQNDEDGKLNFLSSFTKYQAKEYNSETGYYDPKAKTYYDFDYFLEKDSTYIIGTKNVILSNSTTYNNIKLNLDYLKRRYSANNKTEIIQDIQKNLDQGNNSVYEAYATSEPSFHSFVTYNSSYSKKFNGKNEYIFNLSVNKYIKDKNGNTINSAQISNDQFSIILKAISETELLDVSFADSTRPFIFPRDISVRNEPFNFFKLRYLNDSGFVVNIMPYFFVVKALVQINKGKDFSLNNSSPNPPSPGSGFSSPITNNSLLNYDLYAEVTMFFNDSSLFSSIQPIDQKFKLYDEEEVRKNLEEQNRLEQEKKRQLEATEKEALAQQVQNSLKYQSALELTLRSIQVHALNKAIYQIPDKPDLDILNKVYVLEMAKDLRFLKQIFSNGIFTPIIEKLINPETIQFPRNTTIENLNYEDRFQIYSKYGFLSSLLANKTDENQIQNLYVDYKNLLVAFVIPYRVSQEITKGVNANHPVYIPFGLLLMILNHICTIYDSRKGTAAQNPLLYIDYNPEANFFLSNYQQLTTNPFKVLIPFEGSDEDFKQLFDKDVLNEQGIKAYKDSGLGIPLYKPKSEDKLSRSLQEYCPIKYTTVDANGYRGKLMNILISLDYLIDLIDDYSKKDGTNSVYLKPFLENILLDINKCIGNFNSFRVSYNDAANTLQIIDDQLIPTSENEVMVSPYNDPNNIDNRTEIPLIGKFSIAKSLQTKTEISSRLGSLVAISSNPTMPNKASLSVNGDPIGFMNTNFYDRYVTNRLGIEQGRLNGVNESRIIESLMFNTTIKDFYSTVNPSDSDVSQVTAYYIEKMSKVKNEDTGTIASAMVPIGIEFTTDGIGGLNMGQAFTVSNELLPYTYTAQYRSGYINNYDRYVGFVMVGLSHTIAENKWETAIRTNMIALKDKTVFNGRPIKKLPENDGQFFASTATESGVVNISGNQTNFVGDPNNAKIAAENYLGRSMTNQEWSQLVSATFAEASDNQTERAWVMAVILNRTRTGFKNAKTITDTLTAKSQFQAVTGTRFNGNRPSERYVNGPGSRATENIYGAVINILPSVPKDYLFFTSNNPKAYGPGTNINFLYNLRNKPTAKVIGGTVFSITG